MGRATVGASWRRWWSLAGISALLVGCLEERPFASTDAVVVVADGAVDGAAPPDLAVDAWGWADAAVDASVVTDAAAPADAAWTCTPGVAEACGTDVGRCRPGTRRCGVDGAWGPCEGEVAPTQELCNQVDDDCDGINDEAPTPPDAPCDSGRLGQCAEGRPSRCVEGSWRCEARYGPQPERCNGRDDDCDGEVDEAVTDDGVGCREALCGVGTTVCVDGALICRPQDHEADCGEATCPDVTEVGCPLPACTGARPFGGVQTWAVPEAGAIQGVWVQADGGLRVVSELRNPIRTVVWQPGQGGEVVEVASMPVEWLVRDWLPFAAEDVFVLDEYVGAYPNGEHSVRVYWARQGHVQHLPSTPHVPHLFRWGAGVGVLQEASDELEIEGHTIVYAEPDRLTRVRVLDTAYPFPSPEAVRVQGGVMAAQLSFGPAPEVLRVRLGDGPADVQSEIVRPTRLLPPGEVRVALYPGPEVPLLGFWWRPPEGPQRVLFQPVTAPSPSVEAFEARGQIVELRRLPASHTALMLEDQLVSTGDHTLSVLAPAWTPGVAALDVDARAVQAEGSWALEYRNDGVEVRGQRVVRCEVDRQP